MITREDTGLTEPFELTAAERMSPLWIKISTELEEKIRILRAQNDNPNLSESATAALRGQIRALKIVLGLGESMPPTD